MDSSAVVFQVAIQVLLFLVLIVAATTDVLYKKVYNWLTYPAIAFGLTLGYCVGHLGDHLAGLGVAGTIFGVAALTGGVGRGDWKLISAIGAIKGLEFCIWAIFYSSLFGAALALGFLVYHGRLGLGLKRTARRSVGLAVADMPDDPVAQKLPYGVAIAFGTFFAWTLTENMVIA
ncbi:MAG: prepilin peptidase [Planctomycetota bacterium]